MSEPIYTSPKSTKQNRRQNLTLVIFALFLALGAGWFFINRFASSEAEDTLKRWHDRLTLVADSRSTEASHWLNRHLATVESIARDASLEVYASFAQIGDQETAEAQRGFIFSFLSAEAEQSGFHENSELDDIAANISRSKRAGLALLEASGKILVATAGFPTIEPQDLPILKSVSTIHLGPLLADKIPLIFFASPIRPGDGLEASSNKPVAWLIGARPLNEDFYATLKQPGLASQSAESFIMAPTLIQTPSGETMTRLYALTPLASGGRFGDLLQDPASLQVSARPGAAIDDISYDGQRVLATARELQAPVNWLLVHQIKAKEALADVGSRKNSLLLSLGLGWTAVLAFIVLAWRHGASARLRAAYRHQEALARDNIHLSHFLNLVSDSQPTAIAAVEADLKITFLNERMANMVGIEKDDLIFRRLDTAFPHAHAETLRHGIAKALEGEASETQFQWTAISPQNTPSLQAKKENDTPATEPDSVSLKNKAAKNQPILRTRFIPLKAHTETQTTGKGKIEQNTQALVVMEDISDLLAAQAQSEALLRQLVNMLTQIIDARDPWSKYHSARVADVAKFIALDMGFNSPQQDSLTIAGQLINLGKIFVPRHILTKSESLSEDELALVHQGLSQGANLINALDFKGPIGLILAQLREHIDGSGEPFGLKGDAILDEAKILAVANAFVGMVSARAHRKGLSFDRAIEILQKESGQRYDRRMVAALVHFLENQGGRQRWQHFAESIE